MFKILYPSLKENKNTIYDSNAMSQVFLLEYKEFSMLFTGDIAKEQEEEIIEYIKTNNINTDVDILKTPHHGSKGSGSIEFLKMFSPADTVISAGKNNIYGHPSAEYLKRLKECNINYYITYETGQISIISDGNDYRIKTML